jgi:nickel-dependent lactate racemase
MQYRLAFGRSSGELRLAEVPRLGHFVGPTSDRSASERQDDVRTQLQNPLDAPPIHRACTADDRVSIVLDAGLPHAVDVLVPLLESLCQQGGVSPANISIVYDSSSPQSKIDALVDELPDEWADVQMVEHRPDDATGTAYLASTDGGRRVYLSRAVIDADFYLLVSRVGFDPIQGRKGPAGLLFPMMSNEETHLQARRTAMEARWLADHLCTKQDSEEVAQLAGLFYAIGVAVGSDGQHDRVWVGRYDRVAREGDLYVDANWRVEAPIVSPDLVIAVCSPDARGSSWQDVASALESATRLYRHDSGKIALVSDLADTMGPAISILRTQNDPWSAAQQIRESESPDAVAAWQIASAVANNQVYFLSKIENDLVDAMGMVPLASLHELENLARKASKIIMVEGASSVEVPIARSSIYRQAESVDQDEADTEDE